MVVVLVLMVVLVLEVVKLRGSLRSLGREKSCGFEERSTLVLKFVQYSDGCGGDGNYQLTNQTPPPVVPRDQS